MKNLQIDKRSNAGIWIIMINNPPINAITAKIISDLHIVLDEFEKDEAARVIIFTGSGEKFFIGGADIDEIRKINTPEDGYAMAKHGQDMCNKIANSNKVSIAAINGACVGGGNELAIACQLRIASKKAIFQQPEVHLGIIPAFGGTQRLTRILGMSKARKLILLCERIDAEKALGWGLVDELVDGSIVLERAMRIAETICDKSQIAIEEANKSIENSIKASLQDGLRLELEYFRNVCKFNEMKEALSAFKERRKPIFGKVK